MTDDEDRRPIADLPDALDHFDEIRDLLAFRNPASLPVFIGNPADDSAFRTVRRDGIGIVVVTHAEDEKRSTTATFRLDSPGAAATFRHRLAQEADRPTSIDPGWVLTFDGYDPANERFREALCTLGNGYFATRGCAPEAPAGRFHYPGTYVAGIYNRLTDEIAGHRTDNESLVNLPNWLALTFRFDDGPWLDVDDTDLQSYQQTLDLRRGVLTRQFRFCDKAGRVATVTQHRLVAMHLPHLAMLQTMVTAENFSGTVEFRSEIDGAVTNSLVERYRDLSNVHLVGHEKRSLTADSLLLTAHTCQSHIRVAVALRNTVWRGDSPARADYTLVDDRRRAGHVISCYIEAGQPVTLEKAVSVATSRDHATCEAANEATRRLQWVDRYHDVQQAHTTAWAQLWERFDVDIGGRTDELRTVRLHLLHTLQTLSPHVRDLDIGVPARGLTGEAYRGHIFWDELFVAPVVSLRRPALTRALLAYRHRRLPEARRAARDAGFTGAMFPWQSGSNGREESPALHLNPRSGRWNPDPSALAHHVGLAVAYNIWQYYQVTDDLEYLIDYGAETLLEIARFWAGLALYSRERGRYVIPGVIGPDEFHTGYPGRLYDGIDNNAYTNVMAVWVILRALDALDAMPLADRTALLERLGLHGDELDKWEDVSHRMFVPFHNGVISQFEGYESLVELDWDRYRHEYGNIQRLDRILEAENDNVNRYKASKQADVLMLFYLLSADEIRELLARLGYRFTPKQIPETVDYYLSRTSHGSTLSAVVHSWALARGHREQAMEFFVQALNSDVADIQGGTTAEGIHLAAMAGSVDLLQRCFTGLETRGDRLVLGPCWPEALGVLSFRMYYRGHNLHLRVSGRTASVISAIGSAAPITIECRGRTWQLCAGTTIDVG
ncbi:glycoside hydrolase family 65 protein [Mycolicibacterium smegmatis]|uniref:glycoside hydrolase family 65 protein n=1 Tax=Mycolicibacterium smegmatis TaxID=1772 RepID=UPI0020A59030|nr:glycosyl hydrolase family 65 protein [Mycolicibacterium smegmatis]MCP2627724.1 glycoside hydrolase family 65 protein [Mycolicibacterium smegmatis]